MKKIFRRIIKTFKRKADAALLNFAGTVVTNMGNATDVFPTPVPALPTVSDAVATFGDLITKASTKDKVQVKLKNQAKAALVVLLSQLADYVNTTTSDPALLDMTGFELNKVPEPVNLKAPSSLKLVDGKNSGALRLLFPAVKGAGSYLFQVSTDPSFATILQSVPCTAASYTFNGLDKGVTYYCRAISVGGKGQMMYSIVVNRVSQ